MKRAFFLAIFCLLAMPHLMAADSGFKNLGLKSQFAHSQYLGILSSNEISLIANYYFRELYNRMPGSERQFKNTNVEKFEF